MGEGGSRDGRGDVLARLIYTEVFQNKSYSSRTVVMGYHLCYCRTRPHLTYYK